MNNNEIATAAIAVASTVYFLRAARKTKLETKRINAKTDQIEKDLYLDLEANSMAEKLVRQRIRDNQYTDAAAIFADFERELEFQKIAVRIN